MDNNQEHRIIVYQILSEALKEPSAELINELPAMIGALKDAFDALQYNIPFAYYQDWPQVANEHQELIGRYFDSFFYPNANRVVPVESIYRQWTFDDTAEVPFAKEKGYLMSDAALHMKALYGQMGLTIPVEYNSTPDHLCLEFEFAALLLEQGKNDWYITFLKEHLTWVEELHQEAETNNIARFYREVIALAKEFVARELKTVT